MVTIQVFEPERDGGELYEAHEVDEEFVVECRHASELFELAKEPLDSVALAVQMDVVGALGLSVSFGEG